MRLEAGNVALLRRRLEAGSKMRIEDQRSVALCKRKREGKKVRALK